MQGRAATVEAKLPAALQGTAAPVVDVRTGKLQGPATWPVSRLWRAASVDGVVAPDTNTSEGEKPEREELA